MEQSNWDPRLDTGTGSARRHSTPMERECARYAARVKANIALGRDSDAAKEDAIACFRAAACLGERRPDDGAA